MCGRHNYKCSLEDTAGLSKIFKEHKIDCVMHFAAKIIVSESVAEPAKYYRNNVFNLINLLEVMRKNEVKNIIFSSTAAIFGNPESCPIDEKALKNPINPYGKSKWMCEQILADYDTAFNIKHVALRYFNACGRLAGSNLYERHDPETHLIPIMLEAASGKREQLMIYGNDYRTADGTCVRDYIHVCDLAAAHEKALSYLITEKTSNQFNLGNGNGYSVREVVTAAEKLLGRKIPCKTAPRRAGDPDVLIASSEKARKILGWEPEYKDMNSILETLIEK
jgi:UDP-glucose 4-epimerase